MTTPDDHVVHAPVRPIRDRTTLLAYAQLGLLGWFVYGFSASLTLLRDDEGLTRTAASLLSVGLAVGGIVGSIGGPLIVRRFDRATLLRCSSLAIASGALLYVSGGPLWLVALGAVLRLDGVWVRGGGRERLHRGESGGRGRRGTG